MSLTMRRPDDWHLHLRDGAALQAVIGHTAQRFGRAIIMPNLQPPVRDAEAALAYATRIRSALPADSQFEPLMTLYLTNQTTAETVHAARAAGVVAVKLYPAGATTNSAAGVTDLAALEGVWQALSENAMPLLVHGEVTNPEVDVFDREAVFIEQILAPLHERNPALRIVLEHVTTADGVDFVRSAPANVAATITPQHLLLDRGALFAGGLRPHLYCLPVLKRRRHRDAVLAAATSGDPSFFLGTDSAPHARTAKESACGCAGIYSAHAGIELYAEAFEAAGALEKLEGFASEYGADFYGLPRNEDSITLLRQPWHVPERLPLGNGEEVVPFRAGEQIGWQMQVAA